ncbi:hypothetical protein BDA99DRAFT_543775 [Phascolomyces articulosus]|uniref:Uncharacterized protein n=1 Tax=Phascolomyces articulosus TaxID=60185 RepID=A0AAD5JLJ7_9FUNG|nr:hypothetical protein BDA99DRAFT_543775 [Phascolomyces articulosus]
MDRDSYFYKPLELSIPIIIFDCITIIGAIFQTLRFRQLPRFYVVIFLAGTCCIIDRVFYILIAKRTAKLDTITEVRALFSRMFVPFLYCAFFDSYYINIIQFFRHEETDHIPIVDQNGSTTQDEELIKQHAKKQHNLVRLLFPVCLPYIFTLVLFICNISFALCPKVVVTMILMIIVCTKGVRHFICSLAMVFGCMLFLLPVFSLSWVIMVLSRFLAKQSGLSLFISFSFLFLLQDLPFCFRIEIHTMMGIL